MRRMLNAQHNRLRRMTLEILQAKAAQSHAPPSPRTWAEEDVLEVPHLCLLSNGPAAAVHDVYNIRAHAPHIALACKPPGRGAAVNRNGCMKTFKLELPLAANPRHKVYARWEQLPYLRYIFSSVGTSGSFPGTLEPSKRAWPEAS